MIFKNPQFFETRSFGMLMPGRKYEAQNSYRYGFNGKENDNEVKGEGNSFDFGNRTYDPKIGRWFSTDAIVKHYLSPYNFGQNNPTNLIDPDGGDEIHFYYTSTYHMLSNGRMTLTSPRITMTVKVIPKDGPDEFFYHKVKQVYKIQPATTENGKLPLGVNLKPTWVQTENKSDAPIQFYPLSDGPNGQGGFMRGTGITISAGGLPFVSRNDEDYTSLAKIAPDDLISYLEKKDPKHFGGLGTHKAFLQLGQGIQNAINFTIALGELGSFVFTSANEALAARTLFLEVQAPVKLTTLRRFKVTSAGRCKLTTVGRSKLTT